MLRTLLGSAIGSRIDRALDGRGGFVGAAVGAAAVRVATRSIPGALAVGGAALAASLIKRRMDRQRAAQPGKAVVDHPPQASSTR